MGRLVAGEWQSGEAGSADDSGRFERQQQAFRNWITRDGKPAQGQGQQAARAYPAEPGRYHLYVSLACPWAHRALILRALKGLEQVIPVSVVHWLMGENGWTFDIDDKDSTGDRLHGLDFLYQLYQKADPGFTGRVTVPVLWDRKTECIVNNESADIIRLFNEAFDACGAQPGDYYPRPLRPAIDAINDRVYETLNNGVYQCGFARTQQAYDEAVTPLFETLDGLEQTLSGQRYLVGDRLTEADIRLFTTLVRFDAVYHGHFKCNIRRIVDYPALWGHTRELFQHERIRPTVNFDHIRNHYHRSHESVNPLGIVPAGPRLDWDEPHGRD